MAIEKKVSLAVLVAVIVEAAAVLLWAGAASERLKDVELRVAAQAGWSERLTRVEVRLEEGGKTVNGQAPDADTLVAPARAYIHALNKLLVKREKTAPAALSA